METNELKVIIIDDDKNRREQIKGYLPLYINAEAYDFGEEANRAIMPDAEGNVASLVILNGDDAKGKGLYTFDYMRTRCNYDSVKSIPVIVLTEDEFSDRALDFLEIGDVLFYEGTIEEDGLFEVVSEAVYEHEFALEVTEPLYSDEKSYDRILGLSIKPLGEIEGNKRSVALDMDARLGSLEAALERGRQKTEQIKGLLNDALDLKNEKALNRKDSGKKTTPHFLNKVRIDKGLDPIEDIDETIEVADTLSGDNGQNRYLENRKIGSGIRGQFKAQDGIDPLLAGLDDIDTGNEKVRTYEGELDPLLAGLDDIDDGQSEVRVYDSSINTVGDKLDRIKNSRKVIIVVDDSAKDLETCELYLSQKYDVMLFDSGEKALEYFANRSADMILLDTYMPNLGGVQTLNEIRASRFGKDVPAIFMVDKRYPVYVESLSGEHVIGILQKPINMGGLAMAVDGFFRNRRH